MRRLLLLLTIVAVLLPSTTAWAREAVVVTKDGGRRRGEVVRENPDQVTLLIAGIATTIKRQDIERLEFIKSPAEDYRAKKAALDPSDEQGHYKLLKLLLYGQKEYSLAKTELDKMVKEFPANSRMKILRAVAIEYEKLTQKKEQSKKAKLPPVKRPSTGDDAEHAKDDKGVPRLSAEEINTIKVHEIDLDAKPRVHVPREVIDEVLTKFANSRGVPRGRDQQRAFRRASGDRQLRLFFELVDTNPSIREYYRQIEVLSDPPALRTFRGTIHRGYVMNYCGTSNCHGGQAKGQFMLLRSRPNSDKTVYTNFFILDSTSLEAGHMIDRDSPERSLLMQFGMGAKNAATPHPQTPGWRPKLLGRSQADYLRLDQWIRSLWRPKPNYGISYSLSEEDPATEPEAEPERSADDVLESF